MYILALLLLLRRLCTFWCSIPFSGQRSFVFLCRDTRSMYRRFRGYPVVIDIELSMSAWYHKTRRVLLRARRLVLLLLLTAESEERRLAVYLVRHNVQTGIRWSGNKKTISCQSEHQNNSPHPKHPRLKKHFFSSRNPRKLVARCDKHKCDTSGMPSMQPTQHPRTSPPGMRAVSYTHLTLPTKA